MTTTRKFNRETATLAKNAKVEETEDAWILSDCTLTTDGVMNGARKTREDLAQTWVLFNGIPMAQDHPGMDEFGLVIDQRRLCGWVDNVRYDDATGSIIGDYYLAKRPLDGLAVTAEMVAANAATVARVRAGERVETSIGFWSSDEKLPAPVKYDGPNAAFAGMEYDTIQHFIVPDHNAFVEEGACGPTCSVMADALHDHAHANKREPQQSPARGARHEEESRMATTPQDMQLALDRLKQQATDAEKAVKAGCDKVAVLEQENKELKNNFARVLERLDAADKARVDAKRGELARLVSKDAKDLPPMDEPALDFAIERERTFRGVADGSRIQRGPAGDNKPAKAKDGLIMHEGGLTLENADTFLAAYRLGAAQGAN